MSFKYLKRIKPFKRKPRKSKYGAKKTVVDGITFDSKKEAGRYQDLKLLEKTGKIKNLKLQPGFKIEHNGIKICTYKADFIYFDVKKGCEVVEDCKGFKTPIYNLKKKLVKAFHGIDIFET